MRLVIHEKSFENIACEMAAISSWGRWIDKEIIENTFTSLPK